MNTPLAKRLLLALVALSLAACATQARYEAQIQQFVGKPISAVMDAWNYPSGSFEAPNGNQVYVWDDQRTYNYPPTVISSYYSRGYGRGFSGSGFGVAGSSVNLRCQTYFEVNKQKIILNWRIQGDDCQR